MARASLRRQLFHQNLDRLLSESSLHPVQEENQNHEDQHAVSLDSQGEEVLYHTPHLSTSECGGRSPIYKPRGDWRTSSRKELPKFPLCRQDSEYDNMSPSYAEPWTLDILKEEPDQEPNLGKSHYKKKKQSSIQPLVFQFPDPNNNDIHDLPMSPITSSPMYSSTPQWPKPKPKPITRSGPIQQRAQSACKTCRKDDTDVKALPVSPALYLTQSTSTPGPSDEDFDDPQCRTIREHSIFSFPDCNMCRICHEDGAKEKLVSPCHCAGTMGMLHMACLERWLGSSNTTKCEICQFQFTVQKKRHPIKWYMQEPSLVEDRKAMVRDLCLCVCVSLMVIIVAVLCLAFSGTLTGEGKHIPSIILILVASLVLVIYCAWLVVMCRRMHHRFGVWNKNHHQIQIQSEQQDQQEDHKIKPRTSNRLFRRFPRLFSLKFKARNEGETERDLQSSTYISYSLESYKAAMFNPVTPTQPLLDRSHDITSLDVNSPSVMSLDDEDYYNGESVSYYQPPEQGQTSMYYNETGKLLRETGV